MLVVKLLHFEFNVALGLTLLSVTWERISFPKEWHGKWYSKIGAENKEWGGNWRNKTGAEYNLTKISFVSQKTRMKSWFGQTKYMFSSKILAWEYFVYFKIRTTQIVVCNILFFPLKNENEAPFLQALFKPCFTVKAWKSQKTVDSGYIWLVSQLCTCSFQYTFLNNLVFFVCLFF